MILSIDIGIKNLSYCIIDFKKKIHAWAIIDLTTGLKIKKDVTKMFESIPKVLDTHNFNQYDIEIVLLENQPCMKCPTMKSIQIIVYTYFVITGLNNDESRIESIIFRNAKCKLNIKDMPFVKCKLKSKYSQNKFKAVEYTKHLLKDDQQHLEYFESFKKKDDLADAYLQAISYIQNDVDEEVDIFNQNNKLIN